MDRSVVTIGNFDGVHRGHRAILDRAKQIALWHRSEHATRVVAVTFDRPPLAVLKPGSEPPRIDTPDERDAWLRQAGADHVHRLTVDRALLSLSAEGFIGALVKEFAPVAFVEGPDFRFGHQRKGDEHLLRALGQQHGFGVEVLPRFPVTLGDRQSVPASSSLARWLVGRGRVDDARRCLGRPFTLTGTVVRGEQRGRTLGVPTANLDPGQLTGRIVPGDGVYATHAETADGTVFHAAVSVGTKPTFGKNRLTVEAHLCGFTGDLYGQRLTLRFVRWLRDQFPFPDVSILREQLNRDVSAAEGVGTAA